MRWRTYRRLGTASAAAIAAVLGGLLVAGCATATPIDHVANLQMAFRGTMNEYTSYLFDASLADSYGMHGSADYYRVLAKQELARAVEQAKQIRELGGEPQLPPGVPIGAREMVASS